MPPHTIVVALSGGVDSSTAAGLLVERGHRVVGITMRLYDARGGAAAPRSGRCCGPADLEDARAAAAHLGIPFYVVDFEREFHDAVVRDFVDEYVAGRTPNPCVKCNEKIKFTPLLRRARQLGASKLATGHYARLVRGPGGDGRRRLARARDAGKDQSYFLFAMPDADLDAVEFPLGELDKDAVRAEARRLGLPNADKPESQEICFVPDGDQAGFVGRIAAAGGGAGAPARGEIVARDGTVLGEHDGVHHFTVGQRRGLGQSFGREPSYVVSVDALRRRVVVGGAEDLLRKSLRVEGVRWPGGAPPAAELRAHVQLRHRGTPAPARIVPDTAGGSAEVFFDAPVRTVAPGQAAVFYDGDVVIGGGWVGTVLTP